MTVQRLKDQIIYKFRKDGYVRDEASGNGGAQDTAHVTLYLAGNVGDTVLSQCVRRTLMDTFAVRSWKLIPVRKSVTPETVAKMNACERIVVGGGGLFLPGKNASPVSGWQWDISPESLRQITAPLWVFSVGYNYFPGQEPEPLFLESLRLLAEKASFFGLRNRGSVETVKALLPEELREKVVFQPCTTTLIRKVYGDSLPPVKSTGRVALNMAFDRAERRFGEKREQILSGVAQAARRIQDKGYRIELVCHIRGDAEYLPYLKKAGVKARMTDLTRCFPDQVFRYYSSVDLTMGMRGHAQMIPFGLNREILSLGTHAKMKWFLEDIGAEDWYADLTEKPETLPDVITEKFEMIHERNPEETRRRLLDAQEELWRITRGNLDALKQGS